MAHQHASGGTCNRLLGRRDLRRSGASDLCRDHPESLQSELPKAGDRFPGRRGAGFFARIQCFWLKFPYKSCALRNNKPARSFGGGDGEEVNTTRFSEGFARLETAGSATQDRFPFTAQMHEFAMNRTGASPDRFYGEPHTFVPALILTAEDFDFDVPNLGYDVYNIEAEAMGQPLHFTVRQAPVIDKETNLVEDKGNLMRLRPPEPVAPPERLQLHTLLVAARTVFRRESLSMPRAEAACGPGG